MAQNDRHFMRRALTLARRGEGATRPNPPVGAVIVKAGAIIGEGYHRKAGEAHAEVAALANCTADPRGATLYVTLEPCSTRGRTPPCCDTIIGHGLARVVVGCHDPNPAHRGNGLELLRRANIEVQEGVATPECQQLIEPFAKRLRQGLPWVTLKLALSLDGRLADRHGVSQWITGPQARHWVQQLRRRADGVMVGAGTLIADNPELRCRLRAAGRRWRIVLSATGEVPTSHKLFSDNFAADSLIATTPAGAARLRRSLPSGQGAATIWSFTPLADGSLPLKRVLQRLSSELELLHIVCEGGGKLAGGLVKAGLVDEYALFYAPLIIGDSAARAAVDGTGWQLADALRGHFNKVRKIGDDYLLLMRPGELPCKAPPIQP